MYIYINYIYINIFQNGFLLSAGSVLKSKCFREQKTETSCQVTKGLKNPAKEVPFFKRTLATQYMGIW